MTIGLANYTSKRSFQHGLPPAFGAQRAYGAVVRLRSGGRPTFFSLRDGSFHIKDGCTLVLLCIKHEAENRPIISTKKRNLVIVFSRSFFF